MGPQFQVDIGSICRQTPLILQEWWRKGYVLLRLVEFVASPDVSSDFSFTLQDMALCQLWVDHQRAPSIDGPNPDQVSRRIDAWLQQEPPPDIQTTGRRHQHLLRNLLDALESGRETDLLPAEVALLQTADGLCRRMNESNTPTRFAARLEKHRGRLSALAERHGKAVRIHELETCICFATPQDIQGAPSEAIRLLAGIDLPCRGPVFRADANLRILGDVPEDCTVVVENNGHCSVDGYVMGRILTKGFCEIRHNISGVAITKEGFIRARSIINNALVISKMGRVACTTAQGPKLVFAGQAIEVAESTMMGTFITRRMTVDGEMRGSHLEVSLQARATRFRPLGTSPMIIVLRRELSCEDFGEVTGDDLKRLLSAAYALRRNAHNYRNLAEAARREGEHTAQSILMYIFGGGEVQKRLQSFLQAQRRYTLVSNVVDNLKRILAEAQDGLAGDTPHEVATMPTLELEHEEEEPDELIDGARADTEQLAASIREGGLNRTQRTLLMEEARTKLAAMMALQAEAEAKMREEERGIQQLEKYEQVLAGSGEGATKLEVLHRIIPAMKKQPADSVMGRRLRSGFVIRALRNVDRAVRHGKEFGTNASKYLTDFWAVSERLGKDYQIQVLENPENEEECATVTGIFEADTRIFMDVYVPNIAEASPDTLIVTPEDDGVRTYRRTQPGTGFHRETTD